MLPAGLVTVWCAVAGIAAELGLPGATAVTLAASGGTALYTGLLVARALQVHGRARSFVPCRGVGFLGMGVLAGGLATLTGVALAGADTPYHLVIGAVVSTGLLLAGLLLLPGAVPTTTARLRRLLDGLAIGTCLFVAGWTLLLSPLAGGDLEVTGPLATTAVLLLLVLVAGLTAVALIGARAFEYRRSVILCAGGAGVAMLQYACIAMLLLLGAPWSMVLGTTAVWMVGPAMIWVGALRSADEMPPSGSRIRPYKRRRFGPTLTLLVIAGGAAMVGAASHLVWYGSWGWYTGMLVVCAATTVAARGIVGAQDAQRFIARLHAQESQFVATDPLTGLPNRLRLRHRLDTERARVEVGERFGTLLVIDLDDFGDIDDVHGHDVADSVLMEVARRLRLSVGPADFPVRLTGDAFAVLTTGSPEHAVALAARVRERLAEPYRPTEIEPGQVHVTVSIGAAECNSAATVDEMIRAAELAVARAQELGGDRVEHYDESLQLRVLRRRTFAHELRGALQRQELDLLFSPVMDLFRRVPVGMHSHLRWLHSKLGEVSPDELAAAAADTGLTTEIGDWMLRQACRQLGSWCGDGRTVRLSVAVTAVQLQTPGFARRVGRLCHACGVPDGALLLEISERALPTLDTLRGRLADLREAGVRLAIGDFGGGGLPLRELPSLPVDVLRLDDALLERLDECGPLVAAIADLARRMDVDVLVGGVWDGRQVSRLQAVGVRYAYGPLFSPPLPAERAEAYLDRVTRS